MATLIHNQPKIRTLYRLMARKITSKISKKQEKGETS